MAKRTSKAKRIRRIFALVGETIRVETPLGTLDLEVQHPIKDVCSVEYQFTAVEGATRKHGEITAKGDWFDEWTGPRPIWNLYEQFRDDD